MSLNQSEISCNNLSGNLKGKLQFETEKNEVYEGKFGKFPCLVKHSEKLSQDEKTWLLKLQKINHPNIIRIFQVKEEKDFSVLTFEWCEQNFHQFMKSEDNQALREKLHVRKILRHVTKGLCYLHQNEIVHGYIKPKKILISLTSLCAKICHADHGNFDRSIDDGAGTSKSSGISSKKTKYADICLLGCTFFFGLSNGVELEFQQDETEIKEKLIRLTEVTDPTNKWACNAAEGLIQDMFSNDVLKQPKCDEILFHPLLWSNHLIYDFFQIVCEFLRDPEFSENIAIAFEENCENIVTEDWKFQLDGPLKTECLSNALDRGHCVADLMVFMCTKVS